MKKAYFAAIIMAAMTIVSCSSDNELMNDRSVEIATKKQETKGKLLGSTFEVVDETTAIATVYDKNTSSVIGHQIVKRYPNIINLGSRETREYGDWNIVGETHVSEPVAIGNRPGDDPLFVVTTNHVNVNSTTSNGEVEFFPEYDLVYESCSWSNGDTTIVFPCTWDVEREVVTVNGNTVTDRIETSFCEYKQNVSEVGTLTTPTTPTATRRFALGAKFTVTLDPDHANRWLVGVSIATTDSTATLAVALEQNGKIVASKLHDGTNAANNGAYYVPSKGMWYPAIAADRNDGMSWTIGHKEINLISYSEADEYQNWGNNNKTWKGQNSVELKEYSYKENPEDQTITFFFNGSEADVFDYSGLF